MREEINSRGTTIKSYVDEIVDLFNRQILDIEQTQQQEDNAYIDEIKKVGKKIKNFKLEHKKITEDRSGVALLKSMQSFQQCNDSFKLKLPVMPTLAKISYSYKHKDKKLYLETEKLIGY